MERTELRAFGMARLRDIYLDFISVALARSFVTCAGRLEDRVVQEMNATICRNLSRMKSKLLLQCGNT
jgi:hypothetical protein